MVLEVGLLRRLPPVPNLFNVPLRVAVAAAASAGLSVSFDDGRDSFRQRKQVFSAPWSDVSLGHWAI